MRGDTLTTPDHSTIHLCCLGTVESELVGLPAKALVQDAMRRLQFVVHAASWLHSMVLHGRCCCCKSPEAPDNNSLKVRCCITVMG